MGEGTTGWASPNGSGNMGRFLNPIHGIARDFKLNFSTVVVSCYRLGRKGAMRVEATVDGWGLVWQFSSMF